MLSPRNGWEINIPTFSKLYNHIGYFEMDAKGNRKFKSILNEFIQCQDCDENPILEIDCRFELPYGKNGKTFIQPLPAKAGRLKWRLKPPEMSIR
jgi:hypothetical protein